MLEWTTIGRLIVPIMVFLLILAVWYIAVLLFHAHFRAHKEKLDTRIGTQPDQHADLSAAPLWREQTEEADHAAGPAGQLARGLLERILRNAGIETAWRTALGILLGGLACAFGITYLLSQSPLLSLGGAVVVLAAVRTVIRHRTDQREALFETQLADALALAARSIQAGHPVLSAFHMIAENTPPPVGPFFAGICQQQALGISLDEAVQRAAAERNSPDVGLFATAIVIQSRTGGDLSPTLERLGTVIRARIRLSRRVRVLTAQTQFSKRILLALPFVMFMLMNVINKEYMEPLYTTFVGKGLLVVAGAGNLLGAWLMSRMASVKY